MQINRTKHILRDGGVALGTMVFEFNSPGIARLATNAGADFALFDMEHTGWSIETIRGLIATSRPHELTPLVRVPAAQYHFLARVLDVGAQGIMVPMVESAEQARVMVDSCKYPPVGRRGSAFGIAHDQYTGGDILEKIHSADREIMLIAQIETAIGLDKVEEIAAVEGIDALWVGQFDLSNFLGIPGQFSNPQFLGALERVIAACRKYNKFPCYMALSLPEAEARLRDGFKCLAYGGDLWLYQSALQSGLESIRSLLRFEH
jgi:2-dehydro-3-deoxyglucarate aldolase/4-hydroxy-2-oxoheptanedioate aldolase